MAQRRRGRGEGSIYQRSDGRWCGALTIGATETGRPRRKVVYGRTRREVAEKLVELQTDPRGQQVSASSNIRLAEFMERWLENDVRQSRRATTVEGYERMVHDHINPRIGGIRLKALTSLNVEAWLADLGRSGLGASRRYRVFTVLRLAMRKAHAQKLIRDNPTDGVTPPNEVRREMQPLTVEQAERLIECAKGRRYEALFSLALGTGLRWGELAGLRWADIDLDSGFLHVQRIVVEARGRILVHDPKTKAGRRRVAIPSFALAALLEHRARCAAPPHPTAWVFCNRHGGPLRKGNFHLEHWKPLRERAGVPAARFHDLRHTTASLLVKKGVHAKVIQAVLGHARFSVTMDLYSHLMDGMHEEAAEALEGILGAS